MVAELEAAIEAARRALEEGEAPTAAQAATRCWELVEAAGPGALSPEHISRIRELVDDCLHLASGMRMDLMRQLEAAASSRRAIDAYSES